MQEDYQKNLERIVRQMLSPLKDLPFNLIIESISNCKVVTFDEQNVSHKKLLEKIILSVKKACKEINNKGIRRGRPNEVGNDIEPFLKNALNEISDFKADTPKTKKGNQKSMGYPDIELEFSSNEFCYIECKTYNIDNINTTQRSFYLSPSEDFKVNFDGIHFIISFEVFVESTNNGENIYKTKSWKILDASKLNCDVKYEFNSDNKRMYNTKMIIAEGEIDK